VFDRLTQGGLPMPASMGAPAPAAASGDKAARYRKSVLDLVAGDVKDLQRQLGKSDRDKLDDYLTSVNELQRRVDALSSPQAGAAAPVASSACQGIPAPMDGTYLGRDRAKNLYKYPDLLRAMNDLIALGCQCDLTRVITFMSEIPLNPQTNFSFIGVESSNYHDEITHHGGNAQKLMGIQTVNTFYAQQFAYLLDKLAGMTDPDGSSVLDNSIILFTSEFGDGDNHFHYDLPVLVAGGAGGRFKTGRHIAYPSTADRGNGAMETARRGDMPLANLYISIMQSFGMDVSTFGSVDGTTPYGTRPLSELTTG
jgi:hypothetical protein